MTTTIGSEIEGWNKPFAKDRSSFDGKPNGFGKWKWAVSFDPNDLNKIIEEAGREVA